MFVRQQKRILGHAKHQNKPVIKNIKRCFYEGGIAKNNEGHS